MESRAEAYFGRYSVIPFADGWILQDSRPDDPAYIFRRGRRKMYAAKILGEAHSIEAACELIRVAKILAEKDRKKRKRKKK